MVTGTACCAVTHLLNGKDSRTSTGRNLPIVNMSGLTQQDRHSSFCIEPFHSGSAIGSRGMVRRRISPEAGRGLEMLGHALEYLTDEFVRDGCRFAEDQGRLQAIQLLASLNRQIYFACGIEPGLREWVQSFFRRLFKQPNLRN